MQVSIDHEQDSAALAVDEPEAGAAPEPLVTSSSRLGRWELAPLVPIVILAGLVMLLGGLWLQISAERSALQATVSQLHDDLARRDDELTALLAAFEQAQIVQVDLTGRLTEAQEHALQLDQAVVREHELAQGLRQAIEVAEVRQRDLEALIAAADRSRQASSERESALHEQLGERDATLSQLAERVDRLQRQVADSEVLAKRLRQMLGLPAPTGPAGGDEPLSAVRTPAADVSPEAVTATAIDERLVDLTGRTRAVTNDLIAAERHLKQRIDGIKQLTATSHQIRLTASLAVLAPIGQPVVGPISSPYGLRVSPFHAETLSFHGGIDLAVPTGTPVRATQTGVVSVAGLSTTYGQVVIVTHEGGFETLYGHNSRLLVKPGQKIERGQTLALSGNTGISTGPHLHYEIRYKGSTIDPAPLLLAPAKTSR